MNYDELQMELERLNDAPEQATCPLCKKPRRVFEVKKEGPNKGRPFITCSECDGRFWWQDVEKCPKCELPLQTGIVKKETKNKGRKYKSCMREKCYFRFIKEE